MVLVAGIMRIGNASVSFHAAVEMVCIVPESWRCSLQPVTAKDYKKPRTSGTILLDTEGERVDAMHN